MSRKLIPILAAFALAMSLFWSAPTPSVRSAPIDFTIWNFDSLTSAPSTDLTGNAVAASGAGLTGESFPTGNPATGASWSFTGWSTGALDATDYFQFRVDLTNYGHITLSFDERRSATGIRDFEIQYSTNGTNFTQIPSTVTNVPDDTNFRSHLYDLGAGTAVDLAIRGQSTVYFRIYGYTAEGSAGTWRIDNVTFNAGTNPTAITIRSLTVTKTFNAVGPSVMIFVTILAGVSATVLYFRRRSRTS